MSGRNVPVGFDPSWKIGAIYRVMLRRALPRDWAVRALTTRVGFSTATAQALTGHWETSFDVREMRRKGDRT